MTIQNIDVNNGKYTVVFDDSNGKLTALRYGEPWRDIQGDNLVYWLAMSLQCAKEQIAELLWNSQADEFNKWVELGKDEKDKLVSEVLL